LLSKYQNESTGLTSGADQGVPVILITCGGIVSSNGTLVAVGGGVEDGKGNGFGTISVGLTVTIGRTVSVAATSVSTGSVASTNVTVALGRTVSTGTISGSVGAHDTANIIRIIRLR
jgi:hypothetical protein